MSLSNKQQAASWLAQVNTQQARNMQNKTSDEEAALEAQAAEQEWNDVLQSVHRLSITDKTSATSANTTFGLHYSPTDEAENPLNPFADSNRIDSARSSTHSKEEEDVDDNDEEFGDFECAPSPSLSQTLPQESDPFKDPIYFNANEDDDDDEALLLPFEHGGKNQFLDVLAFTDKAPNPGNSQPELGEYFGTYKGKGEQLWHTVTNDPRTSFAKKVGRYGIQKARELMPKVGNKRTQTKAYTPNVLRKPKAGFGKMDDGSDIDLDALERLAKQLLGSRPEETAVSNGYDAKASRSSRGKIVDEEVGSSAGAWAR